MRVLICDDNSIFLDEIQSLLTEYFASRSLLLPEIVRYTDPNMLLADTEAIDLLFLDMEMPGHDGIFVGNKLQQTHPYTIMIAVTSHPDYLDNAMHFGCFAYLTKPIDRNRFYRNVGDALKKYQEQSALIHVQTKTEIAAVQARDIILIEGEKRTSIVHTVYGDYHSLQTFSFWSRMLTQPYFYVTHRSVLINMAHVKIVEADRILLDNGPYAFLSRRRNLDFRRHFIEFYTQL